MGQARLSHPRRRYLSALAPRTRALRRGEGAACWAVLRAAVHEGARSAYDAAERAAWAPDTPPPDWEARLLAGQTRVARAWGRIVGFMSLSMEGHEAHLDYAYVTPRWGRRGLGAALLAEIEACARAAGASVLATEASLLSRPFLIRHGWHEIARQSVIRAGVPLTNFRMEKALPGSGPVPGA